MEINEETYRLFDRYFTGNLSAEERVDFEKTLSVDEKFRDEFQWLNSAVSEIRMNGRSILKKQLAEIGAAIPASAFEKYTPSIKPKSFFKKWWWAIVTGAVIVAAAVTAIGLYFDPPPHGEWERGPETDYDVTSQAKPGAATDSFMKQMEKDSAAAGVGDKSQFVNDDSESLFGECNSYAVRASQQSGFVFAESLDSLYHWNDVAVTSLSEIILTVECCPQNSKPAFYSFVNRITLSANYADTSGLRFFHHGNDLMMTDGKPGYFILTKGAKDKPLERIKNDGKKGERIDKKEARPMGEPKKK